MAKFKSEVEILLQARDEARAEIEAVRRSVGNLRKESKDMGTVLGGAKMFLNAEKLKGVIGAAGLAMAALKGDTEAMEQIGRRLPFGFGEVVGMTIDIHRQLSGSADEAQRMAEQAERTAKAGDDALASFAKLERMRAARDGHASVIGLDIETAEKQLKEQQRRVDQINREIAAIEAKADETTAVGGGTGGQGREIRRGKTDQDKVDIAERRRERGALEKEIDFGTKIVELMRQDQAKAAADAAAAREKAEADAAKGRQQEAESIRDAARKNIAERRSAEQEMADIQTQIRANDLRAAEKHAEAEILLIRRRYKAQIEEARRAGDVIKTIALGKLRDQEVAAARVANTADPVSDTATARRQVGLGSQFASELTGVRERANQDGQTKTLIQKVEQSVKVAEDQFRLTRELVGLIRGGGRIVGFPATASGV